MVAGSVHPEYRQILATFLANLEPELVTVAAPRGPDRARGACRGHHRRHRRGRPPAPELLRPARGCRGAGRGRASEGGAGDRQRRPDQPGPAPPPRRLWRRHRGGRGTVPGQPDGLRRSVSRHHGLPRGVRPEDARPDRRPDDRPPRQALLGPDPPDPRAAHPPREGDLEHLHQPGPARPPRQHLPRRPRAAGAPPGRRALDPQGPLRGRAARARSPACRSPSPGHSSRSS